MGKLEWVRASYRSHNVDGNGNISIALGANKANETESFRRDLEQREAILRATNKQLQDSLQRQMNESSIREERMREELSETRRRWQEAISSREALASELGGAATPLLRQITALQETLRVKTDNWQKVSAPGLNSNDHGMLIIDMCRLRVHCLRGQCERNRLLRVPKPGDKSWRRKALVSTFLTTHEISYDVTLDAGLRMKLKTATTRLGELQEQLLETENALERGKRSEKELTERISKLQSALNEESGLRITVENNVRDMEARQKRITEQIREEHEIILSRNQDVIKSLNAEISDLKSQLGRVEELKDHKDAAKASDVSRQQALTSQFQSGQFNRSAQRNVSKAEFLSGGCDCVILLLI